MVTKEELSNYSFKERFHLWKDLFKRNETWLSKGYFQKEINDYMDKLYITFVVNQEENKISWDYSKDKLDSLRDYSKTIKNTHKFFF